MGEPEPLDLELLQQGDEHEISRAIRDLGLLQFAQGKVFSRIGSRYQSDVETVALEAIHKLFTSAIRTVRSIDGIKPMLATISVRRAINFVNVAFRKREREQEQDLLENPPPAPNPFAAPAPDPHEVMRNLLAEGLGLDEFDLKQVVPLLVELSELDATEEALLADLILAGLSHKECVARCHVPIGGIGGREKRLVRKIRAMLFGRSDEIREILRRNPD